MENFSFRDLYYALLNAEGSLEQLLALRHQESLMIWDSLRKYSSIETMTERMGEYPHLNEPFILDLWELYAFSRVNDILILPFQPPLRKGYEWDGPELSREQYRQFMLSLGFDEIEQTEFHPFFHEIVEVEQATDADDAVSLLETLWPGYTLGAMLISRAGVKVRGGLNHIRKGIAENSTLYWSCLRQNRPASDRSHGWGHNSQWRTEFRRDYWDATMFYYNVEQMMEDEVLVLPVEDEVELTGEEQIELLRNRCFIKTSKPHDSLYPYSYFYKEPRVC